MGWTSIIGSVIGGALSSKGASKGAQASARGYEQGIEAMRDARDRGTEYVTRALPVSEQNLMRGQQAAASLLAGTMPTQMRMAREGAIAAQQNLLAGMPQVQNAILGRPVDTSVFNVYRGGDIPDMPVGMPEFESYSDALADFGTKAPEAVAPQVAQPITSEAQSAKVMLEQNPWDPEAFNMAAQYYGYDQASNMLNKARFGDLYQPPSAASSLGGTSGEGMG